MIVRLSRTTKIPIGQPQILTIINFQEGYGGYKIQKTSFGSDKGRLTIKRAETYAQYEKNPRLGVLSHSPPKSWPLTAKLYPFLIRGNILCLVKE